MVPLVVANESSLYLNKKAVKDLARSVRAAAKRQLGRAQLEWLRLPWE